MRREEAVTYAELQKLLEGFDPHQLNAPVCIDLKDLIRYGSRMFPNKNDFVYPSE